MKKLLLFSLLLMIWVFSWAQIESLADDELNLDNLSEEDQYYYDLLLEKRSINNLYEVGLYNKVEKEFQKDSKRLDLYYKKGDAENFYLKLTEIEIVYEDIQELRDQIIYYQTLNYYLHLAYNKAEKSAEKLISEYPRSGRLNEAIEIVQEIYFRKGKDAELVEVSAAYTDKLSYQQHFWLGQANFNLGNNLIAREHFTKLTKRKEYKFRAELMLGLITYIEQGATQALLIFQDIEDRYKPKTEYYYFLYLTLARIYAELDEMPAALAYYELFVNAYPDEISDEIYFEIASQFKNEQYYDKAVYYFNKIILKTEKSEYFPAAKFYVSLVEQQRGNFTGAERELEEIIRQNDLVLETLNTKYGLINKYNRIQQELFSGSLSEEERNSKQEQSTQIESALEITNRTLEELYTGMDINSVRILRLIEAEFFSYTSTISYMDAVIDLANTTKNKKVPRIIDRHIAEMDTFLVTLQITKYIGHLDSYSYRDYEIARILAEEKIYEEYLLSTWSDIQKVAEKREQTVLMEMTARSIDMLKQNVAAIDNIAEIAFQGSLDDEVIELIDEEVLAIKQNKKDLEVLKADVIENFNKQIGKKLDKQKKVLLTEFSDLKSTYDDVVIALQEDVNDDIELFQFNLLDILFIQSNTLDSEYLELQKEYQRPGSNE
ncbi:MAG: hypothetical protein JW996_01205 [Candidatus Cloacimonetes bacterium]|nr:hypothetical protein [Candidatus Cloacimonadota bacterium]